MRQICSQSRKQRIKNANPSGGHESLAISLRVTTPKVEAGELLSKAPISIPAPICIPLTTATAYEEGFHPFQNHKLLQPTTTSSTISNKGVWAESAEATEVALHSGSGVVSPDGGLGFSLDLSFLESLNFSGQHRRAAPLSSQGDRVRVTKNQTIDTNAQRPGSRELFSLPTSVAADLEKEQRDTPKQFGIVG